MMLADVTLSAGELTLSVLGVVATLLGYHFTIGKYIRSQAGVKESTNMTLSPDNEVVVSTKIQYAPMAEIVRLEKYVHGVKHDLSNEIQAVVLAGEESRQQSAEDLKLVREDISTISIEAAERETRIHSKIETSFREATKVSTGEVTKVHNRVNAVNETLGELKGEMKHVAEMVRTLVGGRGK